MGGNPVGATDPEGLIEWQGSGSINSIGKYGVGYGWGEVELVSECKNGKRAKVNLDLDFGLLDAGSPSQDNFDIVLEDYDNDINPQNLTGDAGTASVGINFLGADLSYSNMQLGNAHSQDINTTGGYSMGASGSLIGSSNMTGYATESCGCPKK